MPDNLAFQPQTGILHVLMDATTSAADPAFTNDDVWACLPDGNDSDTLSDGCVRVMTLKDGNAEFTGIQFFADGTRFLIHLQHRTQEGRAVPQTTDEILVSGLHIPGEGIQAPDLLETYVSPPLDQPAPVLQRGGSFAIQDYVKNSGPTPASDSTTQFYLSLNPVKESGDVLLGGPSPPSPPGVP
jgi:secreted PhoX family phosphatase